MEGAALVRNVITVVVHSATAAVIINIRGPATGWKLRDERKKNNHRPPLCGDDSLRSRLVRPFFRQHEIEEGSYDVSSDARRGVIGRVITQ